LRSHAADSAALALAASRATFAANGLEARAVPCDGWHGLDGPYRQVVTNPPFHRGVRTAYDVTEAFIDGLPPHLEGGGELVLVANAFLDYPHRIEATLGRCEVLAEDKRFRVYRGSRARRTKERSGGRSRKRSGPRSMTATRQRRTPRG